MNATALRPTTSLALREHAPRRLPWCDYPRADDTLGRCGLQPLPDALPRVDFARVAPLRSAAYHQVTLDELPPDGVLAVAHVVADAFARREPQCRHLRPPRRQPAALARARHEDALGSGTFGGWDMTTILTWFVRLLILTDPANPRGAVRVKQDALAQSLALLDEHGTVVGAALNETLLHDAAAPRSDDPFLDAVLRTIGPVMELLVAQDAAAIAALCAAFPDFAHALEHGRVGHHFMVARADALPTEHAFELVAATVERYRELGFGYVIVEATNQWTGAACEALNGVRVHYAPFRATPSVAASDEPLDDVVSSPDGYLAAKDSGSMLYVIRAD